MGWKKFRFLKTLPSKYLSNCCEQMVLKNARPTMIFGIYFPGEGLLQLFVDSNIPFS